MIITVACLLVRCLPGCLMMLTRHQVSKDAGPLVLRHENTVLRRQIGPGRLRAGRPAAAGSLVAIGSAAPMGRGVRGDIGDAARPPPSAGRAEAGLREPPASRAAVHGSWGTRILASPPQPPGANAICERIIGTLRRELLDRVLIVNAAA